MKSKSNRKSVKPRKKTVSQRRLETVREKDNFLLDTDSYKVSHEVQYPPHAESLFAYLESRGGKFDKTVFFGLQYILREYFSKPITMDMVDQAARFFKGHFGREDIFQHRSWRNLVKKYKGKLPLRIRAVREGSIVPVGMPLVTVESTDPEFFWVPGWFETQLMRVWYPTTVSTVSFHAKEVIQYYLDKTSDPSDPSSNVLFKLHDFGGRGVSSAESAGIGGAAHLVHFFGSDTLKGIAFARHYYDSILEMPGFSIPAAEHSTITSWVGEDPLVGKSKELKLKERRAKEAEAYSNMIDLFGKPGSLVAVVSDSYDIYHAVGEIWGGILKKKVQDSGATLIIRPDSGEPVQVISELLDLLEERFGVTRNKIGKGYKVINSNIRLIQGDGVDLEAIRAILERMEKKGFAASNIAFGMGGGLLQKVDRDTQRFAYKTSSIRIAGKNRDVYKDPVTDPGKRSKKGRLDLVYDSETKKYETKVLPDGKDSFSNTALVDVYWNGELLNPQSFQDVRARAAEGFT